MKRYQAKAPELKTDPIGYAFVPIGYAAGQILAKAVTETKSLDHDKLADYVRKNSFDTVVGEIVVRQGRRMGEAAPVHRPSSRTCSRTTWTSSATARKTPVLWPPEYKSGDIIYPYADARKKP